jgi:hypothetical protein
MLAMWPAAMAGVQLRYPKKIYLPRACPLSTTPVAQSMKSSEPPTPVVMVTKPLAGGHLQNILNDGGKHTVSVFCC